MLHLAGGEAWSNLLLQMGVKHQLLSYYYFRTKFAGKGNSARDLLARLRRAQQAGYKFMLDSGAFTYQVKQNSSHLPTPKAYFNEYKRFVQDHGDLFHIIVEFDVDGYAKDEHGNAIDPALVDSWTNELIQLDASLCDRVMPVYHPHRGERWLNDWLLDTSSPLVGFASSAGNAGQFIAKAHRFGKFVHGFAQTRVKTDMKYTLFDSVDSTTWLRADKYGGTCIFQGGRFITLDHLHKAERRNYREYFKSWGLDWKKIEQDDLAEMRVATIIAWRELANHLEKQWYVRTGGKHPYLYSAAKKGIVFEEHPVVTKRKKEANNEA